ncbi:hypothetical protein BaRGS_00013382 [Batillaria attramentaria]|uniref:Uncharacterized protein n=1 Tax=Batillaria attramentaria TaxID=370345 RepID=A0ABD0L7J1_9CAEN
MLTTKKRLVARNKDYKKKPHHHPGRHTRKHKKPIIYKGLQPGSSRRYEGTIGAVSQSRGLTLQDSPPTRLLMSLMTHSAALKWLLLCQDAANMLQTPFHVRDLSRPKIEGGGYVPTDVSEAEFKSR